MPVRISVKQRAARLTSNRGGEINISYSKIIILLDPGRGGGMSKKTEDLIGRKHGNSQHGDQKCSSLGKKRQGARRAEKPHARAVGILGKNRNAGVCEAQRGRKTRASVAA